MHSSEIAAADLPQRRSGTRYRIDQVDDFLGECTAALLAREQGRATSLTDFDVITRQFGTVALFGVGYDADAVDQLLDGIAVQLRGPDAEPPADEKAQEAQLREMLARVQQLRRRDA